ncbi:isochorismatase [Caballeronia sordidicola]|uniref:Isochorismatase n=1 Tax=Caballeronia sordidicola TaxID=196367 RepID=A0A158G3A2_CABSO|nr:isochorismatase family protein [Caballeronia sordidicola]SAL26331.1 isochorismatase [Caballeronia sordidicola]
MSSLDLHPEHTALVAIDLQQGILARQLGPHSAADVLANSVRLANTVRAKGGLVVWVRVDLAGILSLPADASTAPPKGSPPPPASASELSPELGRQGADVVVTKRQWGAFYGTDLEQHLRRNGIRSLIMSGIATNFGVESTARGAFDRAYELVFAEDAMTSLSAEAHAFVIANIFPRMGRVRSTAEVVKALQEA